MNGEKEIMQPANPPALLEKAIASGVSVEVLERLLGLQERWEAHQAKKAFEAAMADLRKDLPTIVKDRKVDFISTKGRTNYRYEDLSTITEVLSPLMAKRGLSFRWRTQATADSVGVTCIVSHEQGHSEETTLQAKHDHSGNKNDIQAIGSAVTYLQRYTLKAALGVAAAEDDDAQTAGPRPTDKPVPAKPQRKQEPARGQQTDPTPGQGSPKDISNPIIGYIQDVQVKKGGEGEGTWTRFGVQIGAAIFGTFDTGLGRLAENAAEHGRQVKLGWVRQGRYLNIESLSLVEEGESEDEIPELSWEDVDNADQ